MVRKKHESVDPFKEVLEELKGKYSHEMDGTIVQFIVEEDDVKSFELHGIYLKGSHELLLSAIVGTVRVHRLGDECTVSNIKAYAKRLEVFEKGVRESMENCGYQGLFSFDVEIVE